MTTNEKRTAPTRAIHPELESVALIDIDDVCATAGFSKSYVLDEIARGDGPPPVRFGLRCTRYRVIDVRDWLRARIAAALADSSPTEAVMARATKAAKKSAEVRRTRVRSALNERVTTEQDVA